ncbi:NAD(P)-dependent oxidoreductase [Brevibacterium zhoupengii]|uniref:NAD(P)-dependent oxidoreductase n=1 Tax=Brevibacterium zhoupengii TaxID=2898795 RepID=UPI001E422982|nr:NAD(P)-dependent oxidoreductase [Brevibacterium zhoupengii]
MKHIAVIGLGAMGGAMASTLSRTGWDVTGVDPSEEAREKACSNGVTPSSDISTVVGHEYVLMSLPNADLVRDTVPKVLSQPGTVAIVDTTTSDPGTSREMSKLAREQGTAFVDAPVSGGRVGAASGTLSAFVGGSESDLEKSRSVLETLTSGAFKHLGGPGAGNVVKLINNALSATNLIATGEALAIAQAWGVDPEIAAQSVSAATGTSRATSHMYPDWILSGTYDSGFSTGLMARDIALAVQIGQEVGSDPAVLNRASSIWEQTREHIGTNSDFSEIGKLLIPDLDLQNASHEQR